MLQVEPPAWGPGANQRWYLHSFAEAWTSQDQFTFFGLSLLEPKWGGGRALNPRNLRPGRSCPTWGGSGPIFSVCGGFASTWCGRHQGEGGKKLCARWSGSDNLDTAPHTQVQLSTPPGPLRVQSCAWPTPRCSQTPQHVALAAILLTTLWDTI